MLHNVFMWKAIIRGWPGTCWEGGIFQLDLHFTRDHDASPPRVYFTTVPFHPNIDFSTGLPCSSVLDAASWDARTSVMGLLVHLQLLLHEPVVEGAVNPDAAEMLSVCPRLFEQLARDSCVASMQWYYADINGVPHGPDNPLPFEEIMESSATSGSRKDLVSAGTDVSTTTTSSNHRTPKVHALSFESYFDTWRELATSYPAPHHTSDNPYPAPGSSQDYAHKRRFTHAHGGAHAQRIKGLLESIVFCSTEGGAKAIPLHRRMALQGAMRGELKPLEEEGSFRQLLQRYVLCLTEHVQKLCLLIQNPQRAVSGVRYLPARSKYGSQERAEAQGPAQAVPHEGYFAFSRSSWNTHDTGSIVEATQGRADG
jgi:ubiquitin-protein ligase